MLEDDKILGPKFPSFDTHPTPVNVSIRPDGNDAFIFYALYHFKLIVFYPLWLDCFLSTVARFEFLSIVFFLIWSFVGAVASGGRTSSNSKNKSFLIDPNGSNSHGNSINSRGGSASSGSSTLTCCVIS